MRRFSWPNGTETSKRFLGLKVSWRFRDPAYLQYRWLYTLSGLSLIAILAFMSVISTLKPWTKKDRLNADDLN